MKYFLTAPFIIAAVSALPTKRDVASLTTHTHSTREVPQEHSHEQFLVSVKALLDLNNPDEIQDTVFGLLGNAAAAEGIGKIADADCLQQATADQAFTNAKEAGDVAGMTSALIFRTLERNTGSVGLESVLCTAIQAVNPEIAALSQHQDPASDNAAQVNKDITLELAKQIAAIGGNPLDALLSGTFAPGQIGDETGAGNTCNVLEDANGCIFSQNLLVADASEAEILAAVADVDVAAADEADAADEDVADAAEEADAAAEKKAKDAKKEKSAKAAKAPAAADAAAADEEDAADAADAAGAANANVSAAAGALDFGSCSNPAIQFAADLDGRKEESFQAVNLDDFNHGSALNIKVITAFIQDRLKSGCEASQATIDAAAKAETDALAATGQAAADAWNAALGVSA